MEMMKNRLIIILLPLILLFAGCEGKKDSEYLAEAEKLVKDQKIEEALQAFQDLISKYPDSPLAPKSLLEIGKIYQAGIYQELPRKKSLEMAISYFKQINDKYPQSNEAPVALFMTGFIQANELQEFNEAKKNYELFLKLYPAHELTPSVESEIRTLGLTPEQILSQKEIIGKN